MNPLTHENIGKTDVTRRALTCRKTAPRPLLLVDGRPIERPSLMACQSSPSPGSSVLVATSYTVKPRLETMAVVSRRQADQKGKKKKKKRRKQVSQQHLGAEQESTQSTQSKGGVERFPPSSRCMLGDYSANAPRVTFGPGFNLKNLALK